MTAVYDFVAQAEGDLSFSAGDKIELVKRTDSEEDWWTGRLNGVEGVFPDKQKNYDLVLFVWASGYRNLNVFYCAFLGNYVQA